MAKLYELTGAYAKLLESSSDYIDEETGEVQSEFSAALDSIGGAIDDKVEGCVKVIRHLDADMEMLRAEEVRLAKRRKSIEGSKDRLRKYVRENMQLAQRDKIKTALFTIFLSAAKQKVVIDDEDAVPNEYRAEAKRPPPDKAALLAALVSGKVVAGAHAELGEQTLTIK
jgi:hypothetical protein